MSTKEITRNYTFSDGELLQLGDSVLSAAQRDMAEMSEFAEIMLSTSLNSQVYCIRPV